MLNEIKRLRTPLFAAGMLAILPVAAAASDSGGTTGNVSKAVAAVETVAERIVEVMGDESLSDEARREEIEALMDRSLDLVAITDFALGYHRDELEPARILKFEEVFSDYVVATYARQISARPIEAITVGRARVVTDETAAVATTVVPTQGPELKWTWRLHAGNNGYRVVDLQTPDISLAVTYRRHIGAALSHEGFDHVLEMLQEHLRGDTAEPVDTAALAFLFGSDDAAADLAILAED